MSKAKTGGSFPGAQFHFSSLGLTKPTRPSDPYTYLQGFNNQHVSESVPGALPQGQNSPQAVRYGLYAEQLTGSAFIAPRHANQRTWLYRARPAVAHQGFTNLPDNKDTESCFIPLNPRVHVSPTQLAWTPFAIPTTPGVDFVDGLKSVAGSGEPSLREGLAIHIFACNTDMKNRCFCNSDGEMMIVAQQGILDIWTEFGKLWVEPGEFAVIPRGIRFQVKLVDGPTRGYILEVWGTRFELPELGPLGANGLANARDFLYPSAFTQIDADEWKVVYKLSGKFFYTTQQHSPFDVVAWHGNYLPYKYDITKFVNVGSISVDHIDPSIFTIMTAKSRDPNAPLTDVLTFSPRWDTASNTYRPPYFHRNVASEFMGLIYGGYGGRSEGFQPGGASYETGCTPHGVAYPEFKDASEMQQTGGNVISEGAIAFMFESSRPFTITEYAFKAPNLHTDDSQELWDFKDNFSTTFKKDVEEALKGLAVNGYANGTK